MSMLKREKGASGRTDSNAVLYSLPDIRGLLVDARINHAFHRDLKCLADFQFSGAANLQM